MHSLQLVLILIGALIAFSGYEELRLTLRCPDQHRMSWEEVAALSEGPAWVQIADPTVDGWRVRSLDGWRVLDRPGAPDTAWIWVTGEPGTERTSALAYRPGARQHTELRQKLGGAGHAVTAMPWIVLEAGRAPAGAGHALFVLAAGALLVLVPLAPTRRSTTRLSRLGSPSDSPRAQERHPHPGPPRDPHPAG